MVHGSCAPQAAGVGGAAAGGVESRVGVHHPLNENAVALPADRSEAVSGMVKIMIQTMTAANAVPHFTYGDELRCALVTHKTCMTEIDQHRSILAPNVRRILVVAHEAVPSISLVSRHLRALDAFTRYQPSPPRIYGCVAI